MLPPVMLPVAEINPPVSTLPPDTLAVVKMLPVPDTSPAPYSMLPAVTVPLALTDAALMIPAVVMLPPTTLPVTLTLLPVAAPRLGVTRFGEVLSTTVFPVPVVLAKAMVCPVMVMGLVPV